MEIVVPSIAYMTHGSGLAARPERLSGAVVGFIDGWGIRRDDGTFGMYPLMAEFRRLLEERCGIARHVWIKKPNISEVLAHEVLEDLVKEVDVVINGEGA